MPATYGSSRSQSANVPWRPGSGDAERGNSSYQAEKRALAIDRERQLARIPVCELQIGMARGERRKHRLERDALQRFDIVPTRCRARQLVGPLLQPIALGGIVRAAGGAGDELRAAAQCQPDVVGIDAARQIVLPGQEMIDPRAHGVAVAADRIEVEAAAPAIVADVRHRRRLPVRGAVAPPQQRTGDRVVAVGEAIGLDDEGVAGGALHGEAAIVDRRRHVFDDRADAAVALADRRHFFSHTEPSAADAPSPGCCAATLSRRERVAKAPFPAREGLG